MSPDSNDNNELEAEVAALKNQVFTLLVALIVVSATLTGFLYRQASLAGKDIAQDEKVAELVTTNKMLIDSFVHQLVDYSGRHPDFEQKVLKKYGLAPAAAPAAPKK